MKKVAWFAAIVAGLACSCAGTETQNPANPSLKSFKDSGCKKEQSSLTGTDSATAAQALVSTDYSAETAGLKCVAWEVLDGSRLKVDLINFDSACGPKFIGGVAGDGTSILQLSLVNPGCMIADCGYCIYDWSFDTEGVDTTRPLPIQVGIDVCPGEQEVVTSNITISVDAKVSGILCNYAQFRALGWQAMALNQCGTLSMPCNGTAMCGEGGVTTAPTCTGDLVCTDNGNANERICAKQCAGDADCGSLGILGCNGGLCRPKNTW